MMNSHILMIAICIFKEVDVNRFIGRGQIELVSNILPQPRQFPQKPMFSGESEISMNHQLVQNDSILPRQFKFFLHRVKTPERCDENQCKNKNQISIHLYHMPFTGEMEILAKPPDDTSQVELELVACAVNRSRTRFSKYRRMTASILKFSTYILGR